MRVAGFRRRRPVVTKAHVEKAVSYLTERGLMADTDPDQPHGGRSAGRWLAAVREDAGIVQLLMENSLRTGENPSQCLAGALKEARRLQSDIYRFGYEVHGLTPQQIDETRRMPDV